MVAISRTGRLLRRLVRLSCRRPAITVAISLLLAAVSIFYTMQALTFKTSTRSLLPQDAGFVVRYAEYAKEFGELEDIVVVVEAGSFEGARAYAARLTDELESGPVKFHRIAYRIDPKRFEGRQLLYISTPEPREIREKIFDHQEFMESFAGDPSLARLLEGVNTQMAAAFVSNLFDIGLQDKDLPVDTRFLRVLLDQMASRLERPAPYRSPWGTLFSFGEDPPADAGYFLSEDKSLLFILVETPSSDKGSFTGDQAAIETIRGAIARLRPAFPNVQAGVTGAPALSNDEMTTAFHDSGISDGLAFALTLVVMTLAFMRVGKPVLMLGVLAITLAWAMGVVTLVVGPLTAAGTFFVLMLTDFRGIQELGLIAGLAILIAWVGMMTLFPAVLMFVDRHHAERPRQRRPRAHQLERIRVPLLDRLVTFPYTVLIGAGIATALAIWAIPRVGFDYNVLNLQAKGTESVAWERRILAGTGRSGFNGLSSASSLEELRQKQAAFEKLPSVSDVDSVLRVIPDDQAEKIAIIKSFAPLVAPIRVGRSSPVDLDRLKKALADIKRRFDVVAAEAGAKLPAEVRVVREKTIAVVRLLERSHRDSAEAALNYLQAQLYRDFVSKFYGLQRNLSPTGITIKDVPDELRRKFIGESGRFLIQIHPKVDIWEKAGAAQFVREMRTVDPDVTGPPIITYEATVLMERAYLTGTLYAFVLVGGLSVLMIRRMRESMLALVPMVLALLWTIGLMQVFGIKFNLANIWGLPLIIGTAAEFGLNVIVSHLEVRPHQGGPLIARSAVMGVMLNGITTMVGFGSLMIASHQGIFSLGLLLTLGSLCGLVAALVVLPVLLQLVRNGAVEAEVAVEKSSAA